MDSRNEIMVLEEKLVSLKEQKSFVDFRDNVVYFENYELVKQSAEKLLDFLDNVEITEEHYKVAKEYHAKINSVLTQINKERIEAKKQLLADSYDGIEIQVKEISDVINKAKRPLANFINAIDEKQRADKEKEIRRMYDEAVKNYDGLSFLRFEDFYDSSYSSKSMTYTKISKILNDWLVVKQKDIEEIKKLEHSSEVLVEFRQGKSVAQSISSVNERKKVTKEARKVIESVKQESGEKVEPEFVFKVKGEKNAKLVKILLEEYEIDFQFARL